MSIGQIFANNVELLEENKNRKLNSINWSNTHRNFPTYNDVVLDRIVEINIIGVEEHPTIAKYNAAIIKVFFIYFLLMIFEYIWLFELIVLVHM